jgi:hypothetical protein
MGGHQRAEPLWGAQKPQKHYQWGWQHSWGGQTYKQNAFLHLRCATRKHLSQVRNGKSRNLEQIKVNGEEEWQVIVISKQKPQNWHKLNLRRVFSGSYRVFCDRAEQIWDKKKRVELLHCRGELNPQQSFGPGHAPCGMNCSRCNMTAMTAEGADSTKHTMQNGGD